MTQKISIRPLHDKILVAREKEEQVTAGGIIVPDSAQEKPSRGKVIAVGGGALDEHGKIVRALDVKVGDVVLFTKWGGTEIKVNGEEYLVMKESDVLAIID